MARASENVDIARHKQEIAALPALILAGGLGTRLRKVLPSTPKPLAEVGGAPFLELLVLQLRMQGVQKVVMCTGHLAEQIEQHFGDGKKWGVAIEYSRETSPLGTAGAVKLAEGCVGDRSAFLVMNGDSFLEFDLPRLISFHREHGGVATIVVRRVADSSRYGTVEMNDRHRVVAFKEKTGSATEGVINGGVYLFDRKLLPQIPDGPASLEREIFPRLLDAGVYGIEETGLFIDIGTPEDYSRAQEMARSLQRTVATGRVA
jgi:NDP-sugar pyrophosphorylase family protein